MSKEKTIKAEFLPGGAKRQELLDQVPEYLLKPGADQATKHHFCLDVLKLTETEYLEALNKATNGGLVEAASVSYTHPSPRDRQKSRMPSSA